MILFLPVSSNRNIVTVKLACVCVRLPRAPFKSNENSKPMPSETSVADSYFLKWHRNRIRVSRPAAAAAARKWAGSVERLLVDPHEGPRLVGLALVVDAAELVAELAVLPLVVVVVLCLPHCLKRPRFVELEETTTEEGQKEMREKYTHKLCSNAAAPLFLLFWPWRRLCELLEVPN